jgi:hypothetical protein
MNAIKFRVRRAARIVVVAFLITCVALATPAFAAKKKKEEAAPTKSYVMPYMIVLMLVSVGLMTVCRPGSRKNPVEENQKKKKEE